VSRERSNREDIYSGRLERGRFYVAYDRLEEYHAGMWRRVSGERESVRLMALAVRLLRDVVAFGVALAAVLDSWPMSCRSEFTRCGSHIAWLGQAACCLAAGVPEALTRRAWWKLTEEEQAFANAAAEVAAGRYLASRQLPLFGSVEIICT
jgi:hypothetical protein